MIKWLNHMLSNGLADFSTLFLPINLIHSNKPLNMLAKNINQIIS